MKRIVSIIVSVSILLVISAMLVQPNNAWADNERTVGLITRSLRAFNGYNLFKTLPGNSFNLADNAGNLVHSWVFPTGTRGAYYLLENGHLLLGEGRETVFEVDWDGNEVWRFNRLPEYRAHHDWFKLPNGNVLIVAWETKTRAEAIAAGRNPNAASARDGSMWTSDELWPDAILEYNPSADSIVWEWHSWDHIIQDYDNTKPNYGDPADHPEMIDLNYFYANLARGADWQHFNAINYNQYLDQIAISVPCFNEIWIIDHSTTTAEAASDRGGRYGKGGRLLYRWGNPEAYRAGTADDRQLEFEHDVQWIELGYPGAGNLLIFNNGAYRGYSSVVEIVPPNKWLGNYSTPAPGEAYGPATPIWEYVAPVPEDFYSGFISGCQRTRYGTTVINEGDDGTFFEVTKDKKIVWKYVNPVSARRGQEGIVTQGTPLPDVEGSRAVHRMHRYAPDFPGLAGKDLTPGDPLEDYPSSVYVDINPGSCPNRLLGGLVTVAILGTVEFDVTKIDPESIFLEGFKPLRSRIIDVGTPEYNGDDCDCNTSGGDGIKDLFLVFNPLDILLATEGYSAGDEIQMRLTGYSEEEGWFFGKDCVIVVDSLI